MHIKVIGLSLVLNSGVGVDFLFRSICNAVFSLCSESAGVSSTLFSLLFFNIVDISGGIPGN